MMRNFLADGSDGGDDLSHIEILPPGGSELQLRMCIYLKNAMTLLIDKSTACESGDLSGRRPRLWTISSRSRSFIILEASVWAFPAPGLPKMLGFSRQGNENRKLLVQNTILFRAACWWSIRPLRS